LGTGLLVTHQHELARIRRRARAERDLIYS